LLAMHVWLVHGMSFTTADSEAVSMPRPARCARSAPSCAPPPQTSFRWVTANSASTQVDEWLIAGLSGCLQSKRRRSNKVDDQWCIWKAHGAIELNSTTTVRSTAHPLQNLVQLRKSEGLGVLMGARVVEKIDSNTQVTVIVVPLHFWYQDAWLLCSWAPGWSITG